MKDNKQQRGKEYSIVESNPEEEEEVREVVGSAELEGSAVCPDCGTNGPGTITTEIPVVVYAVVLVLLVLIGKWAFLIAPFMFLLVNSQIRTCNACGYVIEQKMQFSVKAVNEQVYTLKFSGDLVVVISKRYAMIGGSLLLLLLLSIFTYEEFFVAAEKTNNKYENARRDFFSWEDYIEDCGSLRITSNEFKTDNIFLGKYKGTKIQWEGYFMGKTLQVVQGEEKKSLHVKMNPTDSVDYDVLLYSSGKQDDLFDKLKEGDFFKFSGIVRGIGNENRPHLIEYTSLENPTKNLDLVELKNLPRFEFKKNSRMFGGGKRI